MSFGYKDPYAIRIQNIANLTKISGGKLKSDPLQSCGMLHQFNPSNACMKFLWRVIQTIEGMKTIELTKNSGGKVWSDHHFDQYPFWHFMG